MTPDDFLLVAAGLGAGLVNGVAGGGSLVSFPALLAVGHPAIVANVTSTVGIWSGYLGGAAGFRHELRAQVDRVRSLAVVALTGGLVGAVLLLVTPETVFEGLAPVLILLACGLFAVQPLITRRLRERPRPAAMLGRSRLALGGTFLAAIYGAYFGAGLGVVLLAVLGLALDDSLVRVNGLRGVIALIVNTVAVVVFAFAADVAWHDAGVLAASSLVGGYGGARLSRRLPTPLLRALVILLGVTAALRLLTA